MLDTDPESNNPDSKNCLVRYWLQSGYWYLSVCDPELRRGIQETEESAVTVK
jgi:hypothetical protein